MRLFPKLFALFFMIFFQYVLLFSQDYTYQIRDGNRWEGIRPEGVSAPDLELLSLIVFRENYNINSNVTLKLKFYMWEKANLYITAKELVPNKYYFMNPLKVDWEKGWQEFSEWPIDAVLRPNHINSDQLGIIGRLYNDRIGSGVIIPIILYQSNVPKHIDQYTLHFVSKEDLRIVAWELYHVNSNVLIMQDNLHELLGGCPFSIIIDFSNEKSGYYKLTLNCRYKYRPGGPKRTYFFYHKDEVIN